jgi:hypothetical protein
MQQNHEFVPDLPFATDEDVEAFLRKWEENGNYHKALLKELYVVTFSSTSPGSFARCLFKTLFSDSYIRTHSWAKDCKKFAAIPEKMKRLVRRFEAAELGKDGQFTWYDAESKSKLDRAYIRFFDEYRYETKKEVVNT